MPSQAEIKIGLRPWSHSDLPLMTRLMGDPSMTKHIGGPESPEQIRARLERYCSDSSLHMSVIVLQPELIGIGSIGYWERTWQGQLVWESGWRILPAHQGKGVASQAIALILERARAEHKHRFIHAFPSTDNAASNGLCQKAGFILQAEIDFEYPPGRFMRSNDWRFDLLGDKDTP